MAIKYTHPETQQTTSKEAWRWVAVYKDGTKAEQFTHTVEEGPLFHRFAEIEVDKLHELLLVHDHLKPVIIPIPAGAKPIHFYRNYILVNGAIKIRHYYIGYELGDTKLFACITQDNEVFVVTDPDMVRPADTE